MGYGICQNKYGGNPCKLALDKVVQEYQGENICSHCGKRLKEVPPPKEQDSFWEKIKEYKRPIIIGCVILLLGGLGICGWNMCSHSPNKDTTIVDGPDTTIVDESDTTNGGGPEKTIEGGPETTTTPPSPPLSPVQRIFGGKATYDAKAKIINVKEKLTLTDSEGATITLHKGDVIRGVAVKGGNILTEGEYVINGESRLFTGEVPFR